MRAAWRTYAPYLHLYRALKVSRDCDAMHTVVAHVVARTGMDREEATKTALLAALTEDLGLTCTLISAHQDGTPFSALPDLITSRRATMKAERSGDALAHYAALAKDAGSLTTLIAEQLTGDASSDYTAIAALFSRVPGSSERIGRRIAHTVAACAGWDFAPGPHTVLPPLTGAPGSALALLAPARPQMDAGDLFTLLVADTAQTLGHQLGQGLDPLGVADTLTCLMRLEAGSYYVGLRIDKMQAQLIRAPRTQLSAHAWEARAQCLPHRYLGEKAGWYGPIAGRNTLYRDAGRIVVRRAPA